jgi:hypothetical protein
MLLVSLVRLIADGYPVDCFGWLLFRYYCGFCWFGWLLMLRYAYTIVGFFGSVDCRRISDGSFWLIAVSIRLWFLPVRLIDASICLYDCWFPWFGWLPSDFRWIFFVDCCYDTIVVIAGSVDWCFDMPIRLLVSLVRLIAVGFPVDRFGWLLCRYYCGFSRFGWLMLRYVDTIVGFFGSSFDCCLGMLICLLFFWFGSLLCRYDFFCLVALRRLLCCLFLLFLFVQVYCHMWNKVLRVLFTVHCKSLFNQLTNVLITWTVYSSLWFDKF